MTSRPFAARYEGECACCGEPIEGGSSVLYNEDDELVLVGCARTPRTPPRPAPAPCSSCWLVGPCDCEGRP